MATAFTADNRAGLREVEVVYDPGHLFGAGNAIPPAPIPAAA